MTAPRVAISCGDPAGIGPEITVAAVRDLGDHITAIWFGDPAHLPDGAAPHVIDAADAAEAGRLNVIPVAFDPAPVAPGVVDPSHAQGTIDSIRHAVSLVTSGGARALCTAPITKHALKEGAGFAFPGHTEFLAHLAGVDHVVMMLAGADLRVVPATIHIPLSAVPQALTSDLLRRTVEITARGLKDQFGVEAPRLALAGLNPHAGEGGLMGDEDDRVIAPVVQALRADGFDVTGPHPADTLFHAAARARYDAAIAMYHDQALIPVKTLAFDTGVNVTLGLPFLRTSPDHGTAHDIAGKGIASAASMTAALRLAAGI
ncbi:MAG: 4-hydroxythreonine-4-phosphate dehydrogenase PdxA [Rhodobacteraceae bacterium]|nr:4-hydroxythreonine-4-phosphate dehydrogenase PdxA [Paracoccaceae bacterium]